MAKYRHHSYEIDDVDLENIVKKSEELKQIVKWLRLLKELTTDIDVAAVDRAIGHLKDKIKKLDRKADRAQAERLEEAAIIAATFGLGD